MMVKNSVYIFSYSGNHVGVEFGSHFGPQNTFK